MGEVIPQAMSDDAPDRQLIVLQDVTRRVGRVLRLEDGSIAKEIAQLHSEGKIRKPKPVSPVSTEEVGFEAPQGWRWLRLSQITRQLGDGLHGTPIYS